MKKGFILSSELRQQLGETVPNKNKDEFIKKSVKYLEVIGVKINKINFEGNLRNIIHCEFFNLHIFNFLSEKCFQYKTRAVEAEKIIKKLQNVLQEQKKEIENLNSEEYMQDKYMKGFIASSKIEIHREGARIREEQVATPSLELDSNFSLPVNDITRFFLLSLKPATFDAGRWEKLMNGVDIVPISEVHMLF